MIDTDILRRKIIDCAVLGQLTEHLSSEGDASEWLLNNGCQYIDSVESDTALPLNWCWTTLSRITDENTLNDGNWVLKADMVSEGAVKLIQLGSIGEGVYRENGFKYLTEEHFHELNGRQVFPGYLLINRLVVDRMASCIIPQIEGILMTAVDVCWVAPQDELYSIKYIMYAVSTSMFQQHVNELGHGVTRFRISKNNLIDIPFPFPPLNEQIRIVDKIEEMISLLNLINDLQQKYELDREILKEKIIDAGIRGKLTEQLSEDGDADELYARIQEEKAKLIKEGKIKKEKPLLEISNDEISFEIPSNWKWVRLGSVLNEVIVPQRDKPKHFDGDIPWCRIEDADGDYMSKSHSNQNVSQEIIDEMNLKVFPTGTILSACSGGSIGRILITTTELCTNQTFNGLVCSNGLFNRYLFHYLKNSIGRLKKMGSGAAMEYVSQKKISEMIVPFPPYEEQKRIVDTIETVLQIII